MNHLERVFSQADASQLAGIPQDVLRDWRRRDFLVKLGEQSDNGRWNYSFYEVMLLAIVRILECNSQPISRLIFMAHQLAFSVLNEFRSTGEYRPFARPISAFWFNESDDQIMAPVSIHTLEDWDLIPSQNPQMILVSAKRLAASMPDGIKQLLQLDGEA